MDIFLSQSLYRFFSWNLRDDRVGKGTENSCLTRSCVPDHQRRLPWGRGGCVWKWAFVRQLRRLYVTSRSLRSPSTTLLTTPVWGELFGTLVQWTHDASYFLSIIRLLQYKMFNCIKMTNFLILTLLVFIYLIFFSVKWTTWGYGIKWEMFPASTHQLNQSPIKQAVRLHPAQQGI